MLVNRYQVQAVQAAYAIVYDRALAEDIPQTAFVRVVERVHRFDEERLFAPWLFRIVVNAAIKLGKNRGVMFHWKRKWMNPKPNLRTGSEIQISNQSRW